jgi:hypothetical protein
MCTGSVPASWSADAAGTSVSCANLAGHSSLQVVTNAFNGGGRSACVNTPVAAGNVPGSFSYFVADPNVTTLFLGALLWTGPNCTGGSAGIPLAPASVVQNAWTPVTGAFNVPGNYSSVSFFLNLQCAVGMGAACSAGNVTAFFDDLSFTPSELAVTVRGLSAVRTGRRATIRWRTASALGTLGFNVFREVRGVRTRVSTRLIRARAAGRYVCVDRHAVPGARYRLQAVGLDGSRTWYGPIVVR